MRPPRPRCSVARTALKTGNDVIGAVGIGGVPGGHLDERSAMAAPGEVKDQLK